MVNTFGGTWFDKDWNAQVNGPGFTEATNFYVNLVRSHGEIGAAQAGFTECLTDLEQGKVAMWYDATSAAGSLDGKDSPVAGKIGYVQAPVKLTKSSGWLYAWSWAIEKASKNKDDAWKFVSWASSKGYEDLVGTKLWLGSGTGRQTDVDVHESRLPQGRPLVRRADADRYPERQPGLTGRSAATDDRHPVRGHSGVHRLRHAPPRWRSVRRSAARSRSTARWKPANVWPRTPASSTRSSGGQAMATQVTDAEVRPSRGRRRADRSAAPGGPPTTSRERWGRRAPLLPALVFLIIVTQLPFVVTLVISFLRWNALSPQTRGWAGLDNYKKVFTDPALRSSVIFTIVLTATVVIVSLLLGLAIALLLDRAFLGRGVVRTMMITPFLIVPVAAALLFKHGIYNASYGLINGTLTWIWDLFGGTAPQPDWLTEYPKIMIEVQLIWQWTPFMMLILLAGLQSRDPEVMEAARVDGASTWQMFTYITLPHMRQYLELAGLLGTIFILQTFDAVYVITSGGLGTANLPYTIYQTFFSAHDYGLASAQGVVVVVGSLIVATLALRTVSGLLREEKTLMTTAVARASCRGHRHTATSQMAGRQRPAWSPALG